MANFRIIGYLIPSKTQRSYKIILDGTFVGLVNRNAISTSLRNRPLIKVEIVNFENSKPTKLFLEDKKP